LARVRDFKVEYPALSGAGNRAFGLAVVLLDITLDGLLQA
jgi:ribosomal protein L5